MVHHIVMFRLQDTNGKTAQELAFEAKALAEKLPETVESIRGMQVCVNSEAADQTNYHIALICTFDDYAGLDAYQNHPDHKAFGKFIAGIRAEGGRACIDYED
ncbi:MAG TPA: stress protein [Ruminococcus sp.]|nr:stress protein [Ruminococcus sp.]